MKFRIALIAIVLTIAFAAYSRADISMPKQDSFYDKMGRGLANIALAPSELFDSIYTLNELEGPTVAWSKGLAQGTSRAVMDIGIGVAETVTAPAPIGPGFTYQTLKMRPYDSMVVNEYPPGDLKNFY
jgi:putative exosortase-associated protein (TIGR04073 family)